MGSAAPRWFLYRPVSGAPVQVASTVHPCDPPRPGAAAAYDWPRARVVEVDRRGDLEIEEWDGAAWQVRLEPFRERMLRAVDERRTMAEKALSPRRAHERKRTEAATFAADTSPVDADYPWLAAEAVATGKTIAQVAAGVWTAMLASEAAAAKAEAAGIAGKAKIRAAPSVAAIRNEFETIDWSEG